MPSNSKTSKSQYSKWGANGRRSRQAMYKRNIDRRSHNHRCHRKETNITYTQCLFVALVIQYAKNTRCRNIFPHYLINVRTFGKQLVNIKCSFWFSIQRYLKTFFVLRIIQRDPGTSVLVSWCEVQVTLVRFYWTWIDRFSKNSQISNVKKILSVGADLFHPRGQTDGRTDGRRQTDRHDEANTRFPLFCDRA